MSILDQQVKEAKEKERQAVWDAFQLAVATVLPLFSENEDADLAAIPAGLMTPGSVAPFGARSPGANLCHPIWGSGIFGSAGIAADLVILHKKIRTIINCTAKQPKDIGECNKKILFTIREALALPAYQSRKTNEKEPAVLFLHAVCLASYAEPLVLTAFSALGAPLQAITAEKQDVTTEMHAFLRASRHLASHHGLIKDDITFRYVWKYFTTAWGTFLSIKWGKIFSQFFKYKLYDPRGDLENNAGALFEEKLTIGDTGSLLARTICTPTITVGDEVSPEAKAILQAMENRQKMAVAELKKNPYPYLAWAYVNLQNINSPDEGPRSIAIMRLNEEYPNVFYGITVSLDSPFYRGGLKSNDEGKIEEATYDDVALDSDYLEAMKKELLHPNNFTLENRIKTDDAGYYFPDREWKQVLPEIAEKAFQAVIKKRAPATIDTRKWNWCQKAAFRELVALGIMKYHQENVAQKIVEAGIPLQIEELVFSGTGTNQRFIHDVYMLTTYACKECMDRGGKTNACLLWALGHDTHEVHHYVFSIFHARSLLSRGRLVLPSRVEPMYALTMCMKQNEVHQFLRSIGSAIGVSSNSAISNPAIPLL